MIEQQQGGFYDNTVIIITTTTTKKKTLFCNNNNTYIGIWSNLCEGQFEYYVLLKSYWSGSRKCQFEFVAERRLIEFVYKSILW